MKKSVMVVSCSAAALLFVTPAMAGGGTGVISNVTVNSGGGNNVAFMTLTPVSGQPACATTGRFAISLTANGGQAALALILTAHSQGKKVIVVGTGACDVWGDSETLNYIIAP